MGVNLLTERIKEIHQICHEIVHDRDDVNEPLSEKEQCYYTTLEEECDVLQKQYRSLLRLDEAKKNVAKDLDIDLNIETRAVLVVFNNARALQDVYKIMEKTMMDRATVKEILWDLISCGWVERVSGKRYTLTKQGTEFCFKYRKYLLKQ